MIPENIFDTDHPVREYNDDEFTTRDDKNNTGGTTASKTIGRLPPTHPQMNTLYSKSSETTN